MTNKKLSILLAVILLLPVFSIAQSDWGNCLEFKYKKNKTIISEKYGKKLGEYPREIYYNNKVGDYVFCTYSGGSDMGVLLGCDGSVYMDSVQKVSFISSYSGLGGDRVEKVEAIKIQKQGKSFLYSLSMKPLKNGAFDYIGSYATNHVNRRSDLISGTAIILLLDVSVMAGGKEKMGFYDLNSQQLVISTKYEKTEDIYQPSIDFGFIQLTEAGSGKLGMYGFFDKKINLPLIDNQKAYVFESNVARGNSECCHEVCFCIGPNTYDEEGNLIIFPKNTTTELCGWYMIVKNKLTNKKGLYTLKGKEVIPIDFDGFSSEFCENSNLDNIEHYFPVKKNSLWGYYDIVEKRMNTDFIYAYAYPIVKGVGRVTDKDGKSFDLSFTLDSEQNKKRMSETQTEYDSISAYVNIAFTELQREQEYNMSSIKFNPTKEEYERISISFKYQTKQRWDIFIQKRDKFYKKWGATVYSNYSAEFDHINELFSKSFSAMDRKVNPDKN